MQKKGNPNFFSLIDSIVDIIYYYNNFYKKIVDCDNNNKAKKLNKELLIYLNLRDEKFIDINKYRLYLEILQNTKKMITNFRIYSKNNDKLPKRIFDFIESIYVFDPTTGIKYFNQDIGDPLKLFGIFELTNFNPDIDSYEIINFFKSEVVTLIFKAQIARFKYNEITVLDLLEAYLRIPNKQTRYFLSKMGSYGITILNYLDKISNFNRLILKKNIKI